MLVRRRLLPCLLLVVIGGCGLDFDGLRTPSGRADGGADAGGTDAGGDGGDGGGGDAGNAECQTAEDCGGGVGACLDARCEDGQCIVSVRRCDDGKPCTQDLCDPERDECMHIPTNPGGECAANATCDGEDCKCAEGFEDCDDQPGCEANLALDTNHCGQCDNACDGATPSCLGGSCGACQVAEDCPPDARACSGDPVCMAGVCSYPLAPDTCLIDGQCRTANQADPSNPCRVCRPSASTTAWTVRTGESCNDGLFCTENDTCTAAATCTGTTRVCSDGVSCTIDTCVETGGGSCQFPQQPNTCRIGNTCWANGDFEPGNPCRRCNASANPTGWSNVSGSCDDGDPCTVNDACSAGVCAGEGSNECGICDRGLCFDASTSSCREPRRGECIGSNGRCCSQLSLGSACSCDGGGPVFL